MNWRVMQTDREAGVVLLACPDLDWDNFPALAEELVEGWELIPLEREWGADRHSWLLEFEGSRLRLLAGGDAPGRQGGGALARPSALSRLIA